MTLQSIGLIYCARSKVDAFYQYLKSRKVHFAIINSHGQENFLQTAYQRGLVVKYIGLQQDIPYHRNVFESGDFKPTEGVDYSFAFLVKEIGAMKQQVFVSAELKLDRLLKNFFHYRFSYHDSTNEFRKFPVYGSSLLREDCDRVLVVENANGYGDGVISLSMVWLLAKQKIAQGFSVDVVHCYQQTYELSDIFLKDCQNSLSAMLDSRSPLSSLTDCGSGYREVYNLDSMIISSAHRKIAEMAAFFHLDFYGDLYDGFTVSDTTGDSGSLCEIKGLRSRYRYLIGVQFQTDHDEICSYKRSYCAEKASRFLALCKENGVGVVNLAPGSEPLAFTSANMGNLPVKKLFALVNHLDMVVGIDSCCGHIAGAMGKPSITLFGKVLQHASQKVLRNNWSLVSKSGNVDDIDPLTIYQRMFDVLSGSLRPSSEITDDYRVLSRDAEWV